MNKPSLRGSNYCDIQGFDVDEMDACTELDLLEGNRKALQSTLHTAQGKGADGRCNQDGCVGNWGRRPSTLGSYGALGTETIDSRRPFHVQADFPHKRVNWYTPNGAAFEVRVSQQSKKSGKMITRTLLDPAIHGNGEDGEQPVSGADLERTYEALASGMTLVVSLWSSEDLEWLYARAAAEHAR